MSYHSKSSNKQVSMMDETGSAMTVCTSVRVKSNRPATVVHDVIIEGNMEVLVDANRTKNKKVWETMHCTLRGDGIITMETESKIYKYFLEKVALHDDETLFRLTARSEDDPCANPTEVLCRADSEGEVERWLLGVNCVAKCNRKPEPNSSCARGRFPVVEMLPNVVLDLDNSPSFKCYYYNRTLRIKGFDGPETEVYEVYSINLDDDYPECFIMHVKPDRYFLCIPKDRHQYAKWLHVVTKDLRKKSKK